MRVCMRTWGGGGGTKIRVMVCASPSFTYEFKQEYDKNVYKS